MESQEKTVSVSELKAKCLALIEEVSKTGLRLVITKRGKPLVRLIPIKEATPVSLRGSVHYKREADLLSSVDEHWEADS